jgi:hypothetical protein
LLFDAVPEPGHAACLGRLGEIPKTVNVVQYLFDWIAGCNRRAGAFTAFTQNIAGSPLPGLALMVSMVMADLLLRTASSGLLYDRYGVADNRRHRMPGMRSLHWWMSFKKYRRYEIRVDGYRITRLIR